MNKVLVSALLILTLAIPNALAGRTGVDLDPQFLQATGWMNPETQLSVPQFAADFAHGWDGSGNMPPIVRQSPFGACQTFSMTAMMEYLFFRETGKTVKFSEKGMAYGLLKLMIDDPWDGKKPNLGFGIAPLMIETVARSGLLPDADYPWGDFSSPDGSRSIDIDLFNRIFEKPEKDYTYAEYSNYLDQAFLNAPPTAFRYTYHTVNFSSGKEEEISLRSPAELRQIAGFKKERFRVLHNRDLSPTFSPKTPAEVKEALGWFETAAAHYQVKAETLAGQDILSAVLSSLDSRMVVLVAADVWIGSWNEKLVYDGGGGHAMVIVGYQYRGGDLYFKLRNSWGKNIGVDGYNYVKASLLLPNLYYVALVQ